MGVVFVFLGLVIFLTGIFCYCKNYRKIQLDIPAPNALPIIGHAHLIIGLNNEGAKLLLIELITQKCELLCSLGNLTVLFV